MNKLIIGISGKKGHGKDTLGKILSDEYNFKKESFARPIKESARRVFGFSQSQLHGELKETIDPFWEFTPRWAMQQIGTDLFRDGIDKNVWAKSLIRRVRQSPRDKIVITDVRFPNEVDTIKEVGGYVIRVVRPEYTKINPYIRRLCWWFPKLSDYFGSQYHMSEIALDWYTEWDKRVINKEGALRETEIEFKDCINKMLYEYIDNTARIVIENT